MIPEQWDLFKSWPKTPRGEGPALYTEKLNGENVGIIFQRRFDTESKMDMNNVMFVDTNTNESFVLRVAAQTRNRMATIDDDQVGIAKWVSERRYSLTLDLYDFNRGAELEHHYGEFVKGKGLKVPHVFLFNAGRWRGAEFTTDGLSVVPVLYEGTHTHEQLTATLRDLEENGSKVLDGPAEGVIVFHKHDKSVKKYFCKGQGQK